MMKRVLVLVLALVAVLMGIVIIRTVGTHSLQTAIRPLDKIAFGDSVSDHLSSAVRIKTISYGESSPPDSAAFSEFRQFLEKTFPLVHSHLSRQEVEGYSLLYRWRGKNPALKPLLLMAHMDVVPVEPGTLAQWTYPPFDGAIAEGYIWGRGTLDDKFCLMSILEACEMLLEKNFEPERSIYLAFGHDEELSGNKGAGAIVKILRAEKKEIEFVLDEGMAVTQGLMPGIKQDIAFIGISEKGYLSIELSVHQEGGHSSVPGKQTTIGILSRAVANLEEHPLPAKLDTSFEQMLRGLAPEMPFFQKMVLSNLWLFNKIVLGRLTKDPLMSSMTRTTTAVTMFQAGIKDNVLPPEAKAVVNFRIIPGETPESVIEHVKKVIGDKRVSLRMFEGARAPSPVSDTGTESYRYLSRTIAGLFPGAIICPALVMGATDAWHYTPLTPNVYRFMPLRFTYEDLKRIHGVNERISIQGYKDCINFYYYLLSGIILVSTEP